MTEVTLGDSVSLPLIPKDKQVTLAEYQSWDKDIAQSMAWEGEIPRFTQDFDAARKFARWAAGPGAPEGNRGRFWWAIYQMSRNWKSGYWLATVCDNPALAICRAAILAVAGSCPGGSEDYEGGFENL